MATSARRRNTVIALAVVIIVIVLLLLSRCVPPKAVTTAPPPPRSAPQPPAAAPATPPVQAAEREEVLTAATLTAPQRVAAGAAFTVGWTGPDNPGDYITIVSPDAAATAYADYRTTDGGATLGLTAPMEAGAYEVRYVTARSKTVLARAPVTVEAAAASLDAAAEVKLGAPFPVAWTGPKNEGDYITIVEKGAPDEASGNYVDVKSGSPLTLTAPPEAGDAELRYVSGQGRKVLARRALRVVLPEVSLSAPAEAVAGATVDVAWTGPNNAGDYITVVAAGTADGQYGNYTTTAAGSPLKLLMPIMEGAAELRYMTGQGGRVLARRPIGIVAAKVTLDVPARCAPGTAVSIAWTGPNHPGDYITIVAKGTADGQYGAYTNTSVGSPLTVNAPKEAGDAEVRYMTGQGGKVLARAPITVAP
jgi:Ca-activated chloride channel family protein